MCIVIGIIVSFSFQFLVSNLKSALLQTLFHKGPHHLLISSSLYRKQEEMGHCCRGTVILAGAIIDRVDHCHFVVTNGPSQVFHLRASDEVERDKWVTALKLVQEKATQAGK